MNNLRDYYLQNLGIGEIWKTREIPAQADDVRLEENIIQSALPVAPSLDQRKAYLNLHEIHAAIQNCSECRLCERFGRSQFEAVPTSLDVLLVSEFAAPLQMDAQEKLLQNLMMTLSLPLLSKKPIKFYRSSMLKACAPFPYDTVAGDDEIANCVSTCVSFLKQEIDLIRPRAILMLGSRVAAGLLGLSAEIKLPDLSLNQYSYQDIPVVVTHSAHELMLEPARKVEVWRDICRLTGILS